MGNFAILYEQLSQGVSVEQLIRGLPPGGWGEFLRWHRAVLQASRCPAQQFLSLAQGYASRSEISRQADAWLQERRPAGSWLRLVQRPEDEPPPPPTLLAHDGGAVLTVVVSADGRRAYSGGHDNCLRVRGPTPAVRHYEGAISLLALGSGLLVVESSFQCETTLRVLDLESLKERAVHKPAAYVLGVHMEGDEIYYAGWDRQVWLWNWTTGALQVLQGCHEDHITALTRWGRFLVSGCADGSLGLWEGSLKVGQLAAHGDRVAALAASTEGLISSAYDGLVKRWDLEAGQCLQQWTVRTNRACALAVGASGSKVVVADDPEVFLLDLKSGQRRVVESGVNPVSSVALTPDERRVLCGSIRQVRCWDLEREQRMPVPSERLRFQSMAFEPNGEQVISGTSGGQLLIWEFGSGALLASREGHRGEITSLLVSPDGNLAVTGGGSQDYRAHTWELPGGDCLNVYEGHRHRVFVVGINNSLALTTSWDGLSQLWDVRSGERLWSQPQFSGFLTRAGLCDMRGDEIYSTLEQRPLGRLQGLAGPLEVFACSRPFGMRPKPPHQVWDLEQGRLLGEIGEPVLSHPRPALAGHLLAYAASRHELVLFAFPNDSSDPEGCCRWCFPEPMSCLALHASGRVVVALENGQLLFLQWQHGGSNDL